MKRKPVEDTKGVISARGGMHIGSDVHISQMAGAPVNGTTGADVMGPGSLIVDKTNKFLYINTGTKASPTWTKVGTQS